MKHTCYFISWRGIYAPLNQTVYIEDAEYDICRWVNSSSSKHSLWVSRLDLAYHMYSSWQLQYRLSTLGGAISAAARTHTVTLLTWQYHAEKSLSLPCMYMYTFMQPSTYPPLSSHPEWWWWLLVHIWCSKWNSIGSNCPVMEGNIWN